MKINDLKKIIKEEIIKVLSETAPVKTPAKPTTKPGTGNPGLNPNKETTPQTRPKAETSKGKKTSEDEKETKKGKTNEVSQGVAKLVQKYKSLKGK